MVDLLEHLDDPRSPTHLVFDRQFDRIFVSRSMIEDAPDMLDWSLESIRILDQEVIRGEPDGNAHWGRRLSGHDDPDVSDHFPVLATFQLK